MKRINPDPRHPRFSTMDIRTAPPGVYRVYGMSQSYRSRKLTGYLNYKRIRYLMRRFARGDLAARAAGWPGGMPNRRARISPDSVPAR
jgi:hypothetical protein